MSLCFDKNTNSEKNYFYNFRQPIELDYFEEAVDYLLSLPEVDSSKGVNVCGISKGGELAYMMAAFFGDKIGSIAVLNSIVNCGFVPAVYKGKIMVPGKTVAESNVLILENSFFSK
jgi:hypothetical protein